MFKPRGGEGREGTGRGGEGREGKRRGEGQKYAEPFYSFHTMDDVLPPENARSCDDKEEGRLHKQRDMPGVRYEASCWRHVTRRVE